MKRITVCPPGKPWPALAFFAAALALFCLSCGATPEETSYKVTFYMNDGSNSVVDEGTVVSPATTLGWVPADPVRPGYLFAGWNTAAGGGGVAFTPDTPIPRDIAVYAQWGSYAYTVTFDHNGGDSQADPPQKTVETPATTVDALPAPPSRAGYAFAGWNAAADGSGAAFTAASRVSGAITVYAQWTALYAYRVTFDHNGGDSQADPPQKTVETPATAVDALPAPPSRAGYVFAGWNTAADGSGAAFTAASTVSDSITVYAQWSLSYSYTVTFNANGGNSQANPATKTVNAPDTTIDALPAPPTRTGYVFAGWNTAADGSGAAFTAVSTVSDSITVYAQWSLSYSYTVMFNANGGDSQANPATKTVNAPDTTIDALPAPPSRAGYVFAGWNTAADGSGAAFTAASTVSDSITVYAQWSLSYSYTVTFNANGGNGQANPATKTVNAPDTTIDALPAPPTRAGYVFAGWNTAADGSGAAFTTASTVSGNITVYARWTILYAYTVTFNANGGDTQANPTAKTVNAPAVTIDTLPAPPTRAGYVFAGWIFNGWNTAADGSGAAFTAASTVSGNITVYARWILPYSYTVTFNANGGDTQANPATKTVTAPAVTIDALPAPPTRTGFSFGGWNTAADGSGAAFTAAATVSGNITVYARWIAPYSYTVTFNANGGDTQANPAAKTVTAPAVTIDALPAPPTRTGWIFNGWNTDPMGVMGVPFTAATTVSNDITVYALWKSYTYIVNFDSNGGDSQANPASRSVSSPATTAALPVPPTRNGFSFAGWNTAADGSGTAFTAAATVSDNITVYARWVLYSSESQDIRLFISDPGAEALTEQGFTLVRGGTDSSKIIGLEGTWESSPAVEWKVDGRAAGTGSSVTLQAADYTVGGHRLQVTAYSGGRPWSKTLGFTVIATLNSLSLNKTSLSLPLGASETLAVSAVPVNAAAAVTWSSDKIAVVTVSPEGTLRAVGLGRAEITAASVENPSITAACTVTVSSPLDIVLAADDPGAGAFTEQGFTLVRGGTDSSKIIGLEGTWDSSPAVEWKVDGRSAGTGSSVTLQAADYTVGGHRLQATAYRGGRPWSKTLDFTVIAAVAGLEISKTSLNLSVGARETLLVRIMPSNAANQGVTWNSSNSAVATVSSTGALNAVGPGSADITAASDENPSIFAVCAVTVGETLGIRLKAGDPGAGALTQESFTLSKTGTGAAQTITVTLTGTWDSSPAAEWRVDGIARVTGGTCLLNAANYTPGGHTLQVTAYQGGIPWSKTITFTVTN